MPLQHPFLRFQLVLLTAAFVACSSQPNPQTAARPTEAPPPTAADSPTADTPPSPDLLLKALEDYRAGIELIAADEADEGRQHLVAARAALLEAAQVCSADGACSPQALATTTELLLSESESTLLTQADRIRELEMELEALPSEPVEAEPIEAQASDLEEGVGSLTPAFEDRSADVAEWLTLNARVEAELDDWLTWRRPFFVESWINYQYLRDTMAPIYAEAGLPEALLFAMLATESGAKVHATSRAGALGPLQFMSYTGRRYGLTTVDGFDLRLDPAAATRANVAYLQEQIAALGDLELALAAYNGGENRLRGLHRRYPDAGLWDHRIYYSLPRETRDYVPRILAAARLFADPHHYGLVLPEISTDIDVVTAERETSVGELAICLGSSLDNPAGWFRTVRNLNPRFDARDRIAPGTAVRLPRELVGTYDDRCRDGELLETAYALYQANYPPQPEMIRYTVSRGDTLSRIASRHRCASVAQISSINSIRPPRYTIRVGQTLKIPTCR